MSHKCFVDDCDKPAPYGLRLAGPMKDLPVDKRGYLWHCLDHADDAEARRATASGVPK